MKRIIWHWTAGGHTPNPVDLKAYHEVIDNNGRVHRGQSPISANARPIKPNYARHTARLNTDSIGISIASMAGAKERPFNSGRFPVTPAQVDALVKRTAELCREYNIPVTRETVLSHAEVPITLNIPQPGKWDINWLPGMSSPTNPITVGDTLRARVSAILANPQTPPKVEKPPAFGFLRRLLKNVKRED